MGLINEGGLVKAMKEAYKGGGYTVNNQGDVIAIYTQNWYIQCERYRVSNKVLATIVEHMGMIPEVHKPTSIMKKVEPQMVMEEIADDDMAHWRGGEYGDAVTIVPVIMQGYQLYQKDGGGPCWGVPLLTLGIIERDVAVHNDADVIDEDRLLWEGDGEAVAMDAVRKAKSSWAKKWERAVWTALESVDLHKEE